jgi:hypothetical protein
VDPEASPRQIDFFEVYGLREFLEFPEHGVRGAVGRQESIDAEVRIVRLISERTTEPPFPHLPNSP